MSRANWTAKIVSLQTTERERLREAEMVKLRSRLETEYFARYGANHIGHALDNEIDIVLGLVVILEKLCDQLGSDGYVASALRIANAHRHALKMIRAGLE